MNDFERLGIGENSSVDDIQKAYRVKMRAFEQLEEKTEEDRKDFGEITEAYNRLCGFEVDVPPEPHQSFKDFLSYNKEKIWVVAFVLVLLVIFIVQFSNRTESDLGIALVGHYSIATTDEDTTMDSILAQINELVKENVLDIKDPNANYFERSQGLTHTPQYSARQQVLMTQLMGGYIDVIILDEENYYDFSESGWLKNLDDFVKLQNSDKEIPENLKVMGVGEKSDPNSVYGMRLAGNEVFERLDLKYDKDLIVCIYENSTREELAFATIRALTTDFKELPEEPAVE